MLNRLFIAALCASSSLFADTGAVNLRDGSLIALAQKASEGKEIRIVSLGGSITQKMQVHPGSAPRPPGFWVGSPWQR